MKLNQLSESKQDDKFDYTRITEDAWSEPFSKALKRFNVSFDTENDDSIEQRSITIPQSSWDFDCTFICELRAACGDWQLPSCYFRCQLKEGVARLDNEDLMHNNLFVVIPGKDQGNNHYVVNKNGSWGPPDDSSSNRKTAKPNEKQCWKFLTEYLTGLVNDAEQMVDK